MAKFGDLPVARRQVMALALVALAAFGLLALGGHRGNHAVRNLLFPGAGLFEETLLLGVAFAVVSIVAYVLWFAWGVDWLVAAVMVGSVVASLSLAPDSHEQVLRTVTDADLAGHEFPLVLLALAAWQSLRSLPIIRRLRRRPGRRLAGLADLQRLGPVDQCRARTILSLADMTPVADGERVDWTDAEKRARRVAFVARFRRGDKALERDQAALQSALVAAGNSAKDLAADASRHTMGVPASEPGWVRLLDATLAAAILERRGHLASGWVEALHREFSLRKGHRLGSYWTPLGFAFGRAADWEHALASAVAHGAGWIGEDDWWQLRKRVLGAAARGTTDPVDERMIAAGRLWVTGVSDPEAERILRRSTIRYDPLACAVDEVARSHLSLSKGGAA